MEDIFEAKWKRVWRLVEICHITSGSTKSPRNNILLVLVIVYQGIQPDKTWGLGNWVSHLLPDMIDKSPPSVISAKLLFRRAAARSPTSPPFSPILPVLPILPHLLSSLCSLLLLPSLFPTLSILNVYSYDLRGYTINWIYQPDSSSKRNSSLPLWCRAWKYSCDSHLSVEHVEKNGITRWFVLQSSTFWNNVVPSWTANEWHC